MGISGGDSNLFLYVRNNPLKYYDPKGENVWGCERVLELPLEIGNTINDYLSMQHAFIWVDIMGAGYGLAPMTPLGGFLGLYWTVEGHIKVERDGRDTYCHELITEDPCLEEKMKSIIEDQLGTHQYYNAKNHNCYIWKTEMVRRMYDIFSP